MRLFGLLDLIRRRKVNVIGCGRRNGQWAWDGEMVNSQNGRLRNNRCNNFPTALVQKIR
jgi:hypothetical protein